MVNTVFKAMNIFLILFILVGCSGSKEVQLTQKDIDSLNVKLIKMIRLASPSSTGTVEYLLNLGATVTAMDSNNNPAIIVAAKRRSVEKMSVLLNHGANINSRGAKGKTPLLVATEEVYLTSEFVNLLLENGADVTLKDSLGSSALSNYLSIGFALYSGENSLVGAYPSYAKEIVPALITKGANVNDINPKGASMLFLAVGTRVEPVIKALLEARATETIEVANADGKTPLALAKELKEDKIVQLLKKYGAKK